jgi:hypothetical protein
MAGDWHETLAALIADDPSICWELLAIGEAKAEPICTDRWHQRRPEDGGEADSAVDELTDAWTRAESVGAPIHVERRIDRTVELAFAKGDNLIVAGEVQTGWSDEKMFRLPGYVAKLFQDHQKQVELVILCKTDGLARRYRNGIWMGVRSVVMPIAVGPRDLEPITHPNSSGQSVQLMVATMLLRGAQDMKSDPEVIVELVAARLDTIKAELAGVYAVYLTRLVSEQFAILLEETMKTRSKPWHNEYFSRVHEDGVERGREVGREEGRLAQGRITLLALLGSRGIPVSTRFRSRIEFCSDLDQLEAWTMRAVHVRSCEELFEDA